MTSDVSVSAPTEECHPGTTAIDTQPTLEVLRLLNTGVRIQPGGIDVPGLARAADGLLSDELGADTPDVVVWSMRGLLFLADRAEVMRMVKSTLGAGRTVVVSDAVANLVGALGGLHPGAVVAVGTGAVAFGTDFGDTWRLGGAVGTDPT